MASPRGCGRSNPRRRIGMNRAFRYGLVLPALMAIAPAFAQVITGDDTGTVVEDASNLPTATGTLRITGSDGATFTRQMITLGDYGAFAIEPDGDWTYGLDNNNPATNALAARVERTETFTAVVAGTDPAVTRDVRIMVIGANDAPSAVINAPVPNTQVALGAVVTLSGAGSDPDTRDRASLTYRWRTTPGNLGSFADATAAVTIWTAPANAVDVTLALTVSDGLASDEAMALVEVVGTPLRIVGDLAADVAEDAASNVVTGTVQIRGPAGDEFEPASFRVQEPNGAFGSITPTGDSGNTGQWVWTYTLNNQDPAVQSLNTGETLRDVFEIRASRSGSGERTLFATLTITINGLTEVSAQPAVFGGEQSGRVVEDANPNRASGTLTVRDPDGADLVMPLQQTAGGYGTFDVFPFGLWRYTLDPALAQPLSGGQTVTDTFTVTAADDGLTPATTNVVITITGVNDAAVFGGALNAAIGEDSGRINRTLTIADVDGDDEVVPRTNIAGDYGAFTITSAGAWSYAPGDAAQALTLREVVTDTFRVTAADDGGGASGDGPAATDVVIEITGANDAPIGNIIRPATPGMVVPAGGTLNVRGSGRDPDADDDADTLRYSWDSYLPLRRADKRGTFLDPRVANPVWTAPIVTVDQSVTVVLRLDVTDRHGANTNMSSATVTVLVSPSPVVGGDLNRALTEGAAQNTATGTLDHLYGRPDNDTFRAQTDINGTYGVFNLESAGAWTYALDNDRAATRALGEGVTGEDLFAVASNASDGVGATVTITITGVNSRPTATILAPANNTAVGLNSGLPVEGAGSDPDAGQTDTLRYFWRTTPPGRGSFVVGIAASTLWLSPADVVGDGTVQLQLMVVDDSRAGASNQHTASVTVVTTADTIIGGSLNGAVAVNGRERASGMLTIANGAPGDPVTFVSQTSPGAYGLFTLATDGGWTYTLTPALPATIALAAGEIGTDSFPVAGGAAGALSGMVVIRVTGGNDAPTAAIATPTARVTLESRETLMVASGASDPDNGETGTLRYQWSTMPAGRGAFDNDAGAQTIWTAQSRPIGSSGQNTTLVLTATDAGGLSDTATTVVTVVGATDLQPSFAGAVVDDRNFRPSLVAPRQVLPAAVGGNRPLSYSLRSDPPGLIDRALFTDRLSFNVNMRVLAGRPAQADVGAYTMTYEARDANGDAVTLTFRITVGGDAPLFPEDTDFFPDLTLAAGTALRDFALPEATPAAAGDTLTYSVTSTPPQLGLELNFNPSTRRYRNLVLTTPGAYTVTYRVADQNGNSDFRTATWTVTPDPQRPSFGIGALPDLIYVVGTTHDPVTLRAAVGGNRPLAYSVTTALPAGLSFDAGSRELRGTPSNAGSYDTIYRAQDANGDDVTAEFTIEAVADREPDFGAASVAAQTYTMGTAVNLSLPAASGGNPPLSYELSPLPAGLSFDADTRVLSGIPTDPQEQTTHAYTVRDRDNDAATLTFAITVLEADVEPAFAAGQPDLAG